MKILSRGAALSLLLAAAASAALADPAPATAPQTPFGATTLNLAAYGEVQARADMATVHVGVTTEARSAAEALAANAGRMSQVMAALKAAGIAAGISRPRTST